MFSKISRKNIIRTGLCIAVLLCFLCLTLAFYLLSPKTNQAESVFAVYAADTDKLSAYQQVSAAHVCAYLLHDGAAENATVARSVIAGEQLNLTTKQLLRAVKVERIPDTLLMRVTVQHSDPALAVQLANRYPAYLVGELDDAFGIGSFEMILSATESTGTFSWGSVLLKSLLGTVVLIVAIFLFFFLRFWQKYRASTQVLREEAEKGYQLNLPMLRLAKRHWISLLAVFLAVALLLGIFFVAFSAPTSTATQMVGVSLYPSSVGAYSDQMIYENNEFFHSYTAYFEDPVLLNLFYDSLPLEMQYRYSFDELKQAFQFDTEYFGVVRVDVTLPKKEDAISICRSFTGFAFPYVQSLMHLGEVQEISATPVAFDNSTAGRLVYPVVGGLTAALLLYGWFYLQEKQTMSELRRVAVAARESLQRLENGKTDATADQTMSEK